MYRKGNLYDDIAKTVIQIYLDYNIKSFPVDEKEVCGKMGVTLFRYSSMTKDEQRLLEKKSEFGFFVPETKNNPPSIYYNDMLESEGAQRFTIFHELKHYVYDDKDESKDDLADYFSKYFMCPIPYLLLMNIDSTNEVTLMFGTSYKAAENICSNLTNRKIKYGYQLFDYEVELIEHLAPELLKINEIINGVIYMS